MYMFQDMVANTKRRCTWRGWLCLVLPVLVCMLRKCACTAISTRTALVLKTHIVQPFQMMLFKNMYRDLKGDAYLLLTNEAAEPALHGWGEVPNVVIFMHNSSLKRKIDHQHSVEHGVLEMEKYFKGRYDYMWLFESDAIYNGKYSDLLKLPDCDYMSMRGLTFNTNNATNWHWGALYGPQMGKVPLNLRAGAVSQVNRYSMLYMQQLRAVSENGNGGFNEVFLPTVAYHYNFSICAITDSGIDMHVIWNREVGVPIELDGKFYHKVSCPLQVKSS